MKIKHFFTWALLICKHILKLPIISAMLLLIPALTIIVQALPEEGSASGTAIGIYFEEADELSCKMEDELLHSEGAFSFISYGSHEDLIDDVMLGKLECGYIFDSDFSDKINKGKYDKAITLVKSPATIFDSAANELVFAALIRQSGYNILHKYAEIDELSSSQREELISSLFTAYDSYCSSGETFHLDIITAEGISINDEAGSSLGITFPLRGVLAILIFLAGMTGCAAWLKDREKGLFAPRPHTFYILSRILYPLLPTVLFLLCSELAMFISGSAYSPASELLLSIRYIVLITAFANLCSLILKRSTLVISLIPVLILGSLIFCPVFVNMESFLPMLRFVSHLFLPRYFL